MNAPAAKRKVLVGIAGFVWTGVGLALALVGSSWFSGKAPIIAIWILLGLAVGYVLYRFKLSHLARANLERIYSQAPGKEKVCVFAFQSTRSYVMIVVMMAMGHSLRMLPVPRGYLAPLYLAMGSALLLSSLIYYRRLFR